MTDDLTHSGRFECDSAATRLSRRCRFICLWILVALSRIYQWILDARLRDARMDRCKLTFFSLSALLTSLGGEFVAQAGDVDPTELTVTDVSNVLDDEDWVLVDTRETDAYNGWRLDRVERGGHLPGAVDFPAQWLDSDHKHKVELLSAALRVKGIERRKHIVLYSSNQQDRDRVAAYLHKAGYRHLYEFDFNAWANDATKPLVRYKNFHLLVPASIVRQLLDGQLPETFEQATQLKFVEVSWGDEGRSYSNGHIPGSFHVNTDHFEPPPEWMLGTPEVLHRFAERYGFEADDTVVISGKDPTASFRLAVVLRYMGVQDVRVLNGGFSAWEAAGYPVETESNLPPEAPSFGAQIPQRPQLIDDLARVKDGLSTPSEFTLVDTRTWAEFTGETSGYSYHFRKGRIPGSVYGQADFQGADSLTPYRNIDNTMRNAEEILTLWKKAKVDTRKQLSFMCGSGWRAAEVLTFAQVIGLSNTSLYSDGWIGWSNDQRNPVETGPITDDHDLK